MSKQLITFLFAFLAFGPLLAQVDSTLTADSTQTKKVSGRAAEYKVYAGVTLSQITGLEENYESEEAAGFNLGVAIRKGRFAYWRRAFATTVPSCSWKKYRRTKRNRLVSVK